MAPNRPSGSKTFQSEGLVLHGWCSEGSPRWRGGAGGVRQRGAAGEVPLEGCLGWCQTPIQRGWCEGVVPDTYSEEVGAGDDAQDAPYGLRSSMRTRPSGRRCRRSWLSGFTRKRHENVLVTVFAFQVCEAEGHRATEP